MAYKIYTEVNVADDIHVTNLGCRNNFQDALSIANKFIKDNATICIEEIDDNVFNYFVSVCDSLALHKG